MMAVTQPVNVTVLDLDAEEKMVADLLYRAPETLDPSALLDAAQNYNERAKRYIDLGYRVSKLAVLAGKAHGFQEDSQPVDPRECPRCGKPRLTGVYYANGLCGRCTNADVAASL